MPNLSLRPTPGYLVWRLATKLRTAVDSAVGPLGLTHAQYSVLSTLRGFSSAGLYPSQRQLADHTGLEPMFISKLVRALEGRGLIERRPDPADSRAVRLAVTEKGTEVADQAVVIVADLMGQFTSPLGGVSSKRTHTFMRDVRALLDGPLFAHEPSLHTRGNNSKTRR